jgi:hypothetical protein
MQINSKFDIMYANITNAIHVGNTTNVSLVFHAETVILLVCKGVQMKLMYFRFSI